MKKIASVIALVSLIMGADGGIYLSTTNLYPETAIVSDVDYVENVVYCEDFNGNVWGFTETEGWQKGDICSLIMDNMGTATIYDDEIVAVKYSGYVEKSEDELFNEYLEEISCGNYEEE